MKTPNFFMFFIIFVLGAHVFAQSDNDSASQQKVDSKEERIKKEASVKQAEDQFSEMQKRFDEAAEELQEARNEYYKELSELTKPLLNEMIDLSKQFSERLSPFAPYASRNLLNTEALQQQLEYLSEGVVGVYLRAAETGGVIVTSVSEGAPAARAGIQSGDVVIQIDDVDLMEVDTPYETLATIINDKGPDSIVRLKIRRFDEHIDYELETIDRLTLNALDAQNQNFAIVSGSPTRRPDVLPATQIPYSYFQIPQRTNNNIFVMEVEDALGQYFGVEYGVLVLKADDVEGLQPGDILLEIDEQPVRSLSHALRYKRDADDEVEILFKRNKRDKSITLEKDEFNLNAILQ